MQIKTSGIKYMGSKQKILPFISDKTNEIFDGDKNWTVLDVFAGSTRVAQAYRQLGYKVLTSDLNWATEAYSKAYLSTPTADRTELQLIIDQLNNVTPIEGWLTQMYGEVKPTNPKDPTKLVNAFKRANAMKADAIRETIETYRKAGLEDWEYHTLITSLIMALDEVQNSQGHSRAFFRDFDTVPASKRSLTLKLPPLMGNPTIDDEILLLSDDDYIAKYPIGAHRTGNVLDLEYVDFVKQNSGNTKILAYLDPPYTTFVQYDLFYHIWDSVFKWDKPATAGATNRRADRMQGCSPEMKSDWCKKTNAKDAFIQLFNQLNFVDAFVISYSDESILSHDDMIKIFLKVGFTPDTIHETTEITYKRHMLSKIGTASEETKQTAKANNIEYVFTLIRK